MHTILGERTKQLDIFCRVTWLYEWLSQFCRCGPYSVLSRSPSLVIPFQLQTCCAHTLLQYQDAFLTPLKLRPHGAIEFWLPLSLWLSLLPNQHSQQFRKWWIIICTAFVWQTNFTVHMVLMTLNMQTHIWTTESKMKCYSEHIAIQYFWISCIHRRGFVTAVPTQSQNLHLQFNINILQINQSDN